MEEKRFVCKFCNKRFPCGKSLGGHIRTHMNEYSAQENGAKGNADFVTVASFDGGRKRRRDSAVYEADAAAAGNSAYGLRENPKKTMRFVDSSSATVFEAKLCKECGKGFASLKALCGHMACHSEKERGTGKFEDHFGVSGKDKFVMDSQSDTETSTPTHPRRSKRMMRFKNLNPQPSPSSLANTSSLTELELEQEEGAKLLLLLSKDSGPRGLLNSVADSSENNSVVLEVKSPSVDTKMIARYVNNKQQHDGNLTLKSAVVSVSDDSNSEYFLSGYNKIESEVSADGYPRNSDFFKKPKVDCSGFEDLGSEFGKSVNRIKVKNSESNKKKFKALDFDQAEGTMRKEEKSHSFSLHRSTPSKKVVNVAAASEEGYESLTNKNVNSGYESTYDSEEQSTDSDSFSVPMRRGSKSLKQKQSSNSKKMSGSKKNKGHECPICYRIFKSGQALGGHKRSHFVGGSEENPLVIKQDISHVQCLIDLNLPAPVD